MDSKRSGETIDIYRDHDFIQNKRFKLSSNAPFIPVYVTSQLTQTSDPSAVYVNRVKGRHILLENPVRESRAKKERDEKRGRQRKERERKKIGAMGKREAREKGVWRLHESQAKFDLFLPLHHLWMGYISELLGLHQLPEAGIPSADAMPSSSSMHPKLVKADFHGSIMTVRQSKNPCLVGLSGIVIHETENVFRIITEKDKVKLIPKENSIFAFSVPLYSTLPPSRQPQSSLQIPQSPKGTVLQAPHIEFELHGNQFRFRAADRAGRKFKHKETIEL